MNDSVYMHFLVRTLDCLTLRDRENANTKVSLKRGSVNLLKKKSATMAATQADVKYESRAENINEI